jgi:hypothetical protein
LRTLKLAMLSVLVHGIHTGTRAGSWTWLCCDDRALFGSSARLASPGRDDREGGEVESARVDVGEMLFELLGCDEPGGDQPVLCSLNQGPVQLRWGGAGEGEPDLGATSTKPRPRSRLGRVRP